MTNELNHRGPDDAGYEFFPTEEASIGLGFRRLSIIDLTSSGHQPMRDENGDVWLMLNGEIYNYEQIRNDLIKLGFSFRSTSDTEVALKAYLAYGAEMVSKFIGMFSIVVYDIRKSRIMLIRDRAGVKPLFWYYNDGLFMFASELKAFHKNPYFTKEINRNALGYFFSNGSIPAPYTIFNFTSKVLPGSYVEFNIRSRELTLKKYWDVFNVYDNPEFDISYNEAKSELVKLMSNACKYRMIADVPVGVFLSGGYDSTAVVALLKDQGFKLNTYTIGFNVQRYDESDHAVRVADYLGVDNIAVTCDFREATSIIPELPEIFDEPFGDPSAIPTTLVSRIAKKYVKVALSADAGDELFAGYPRHIKALRYLRLWSGTPEPVRKLGGNLLRLLHYDKPPLYQSDIFNKRIRFLKAGTLAEAFESINQTFTIDEVNRMLSYEIKEVNSIFNKTIDYRNVPDILNQLLAIEYSTYLVDDIMQKVDRASMSCSLEGREPFLDHRLVEFTAKLPADYKMSNGVSKRILKDIVHDFVPKEIMDRPKMGFGVPIDDWLKNELKDLFEEVMDENFAARTGLFQSGVIKQLKKGYYLGRNTDIYRIWYVFVFLQWYKRWM